MIDGPGIFYDVDADTYHADPLPAPSLSSGVARTLIDRSPLHAWTQHPRLNPDYAPREEARFDFGSAAHMLVLGRGRDLAVIDAPDWRKSEAKEARDAARAEGKTPILAADHERALAVAGAFATQVEAYPEAFAAFSAIGRSEVVIAWMEQGVWCRGMADRLALAEEEAVLIDYKTTQASAHPAAVSRRLYDLGQDLQLAFYRRGILALRPSVKRFRALLLTQEVDPPYALSVVSLDPATWQMAEQRIDLAIGLWRRCLAADEWPGYPAEIATAELPVWKENDWIERRDAMRRQALDLNPLMAG